MKKLFIILIFFFNSYLLYALDENNPRQARPKTSSSAVQGAPNLYECCKMCCSLIIIDGMRKADPPKPESDLLKKAQKIIPSLESNELDVLRARSGEYEEFLKKVTLLCKYNPRKLNDNNLLHFLTYFKNVIVPLKDVLILDPGEFKEIKKSLTDHEPSFRCKEFSPRKDILSFPEAALSIAIKCKRFSLLYNALNNLFRSNVPAEAIEIYNKFSRHVSDDSIFGELVQKHLDPTYGTENCEANALVTLIWIKKIRDGIPLSALTQAEYLDFMLRILFTNEAVYEERDRRFRIEISEKPNPMQKLFTNLTQETLRLMLAESTMNFTQTYVQEKIPTYVHPKTGFPFHTSSDILEIILGIPDLLVVLEIKKMQEEKFIEQDLLVFKNSPQAKPPGLEFLGNLSGMRRDPNKYSKKLESECIFIQAFATASAVTATTASAVTAAAASAVTATTASAVTAAAASAVTATAATTAASAVTATAATTAVTTAAASAAPTTDEAAIPASPPPGIFQMLADALRKDISRAPNSALYNTLIQQNLSELLRFLFYYDDLRKFGGGLPPAFKRPEFRDMKSEYGAIQGPSPLTILHIIAGILAAIPCVELDGEKIYVILPAVSGENVLDFPSCPSPNGSFTAASSTYAGNSSSGAENSTSSPLSPLPPLFPTVLMFPKDGCLR